MGEEGLPALRSSLSSKNEASATLRPMASLSSTTAVGLLWPRSISEMAERLTPLRSASASSE